MPTYLKIYAVFVDNERCYEICQAIQYCYGSDLFTTWKLDAISGACFSEQKSDKHLLEVQEVLQTISLKLMRGEIKSIDLLTLNELRGKPRVCGLVHVIAMRIVVITHFLAGLQPQHILRKVFNSMASSNQFFQSEKQVALGIKTGKPVSVDNNWKSHLS